MAIENASIAAMSKLDQIIRDPELRRDFKANPHATLQAMEAEPDNVPQDVWQALTGMTLEELGAIATLGAALYDAGCLDGSLVWQFVV